MLDEAGEFCADRGGEGDCTPPRFFAAAAASHPSSSSPRRIRRSEREVKARIALNRAGRWGNLRRPSTRDVIDRQVAPGVRGIPSPRRALLVRYPWASGACLPVPGRRMVVSDRSDFKAFLVTRSSWRAYCTRPRRVRKTTVKTPITDRTTGPASVLHETRRTGIACARSRPACSPARLGKLKHSSAVPFGNRARLRLSEPRGGLRRPLPPPSEYDSGVKNVRPRLGDVSRQLAADREGAVLHDARLSSARLSFSVAIRLRTRLARNESCLGNRRFWTPEYWEAERRDAPPLSAPRVLVAGRKAPRCAQGHGCDVRTTYRLRHKLSTRRAVSPRGIGRNTLLANGTDATFLHDPSLARRRDRSEVVRPDLPLD